MKKTIVKLDHISKSFIKKKYVIKDLSLEVHEGEFLTLLGSSGCGKTTILRMISGLDRVTSGKVYIDGEDVTDVEPQKREVNTIFQNFALFPHMTVFENVAFGLKMKRVPPLEIQKRVKKAIRLVELDGLEDRIPAQLSGGQQQRVAIARGIVMNPKVLLLDESLCSLDLKLKKQMQIELKKIQKRLGITFIYVTHDQDEALTMSDRIVIIEKGRIEQDDTPENIYRFPKSVFVADFIGESNILPGVIKKIDSFLATVEINKQISFQIPVSEGDQARDKIHLMIRPENIKVSKTPLKDGIKGTIEDVIYDGSITKLFVRVDSDFVFKSQVSGVVHFTEKDLVYLKIDAEHIVGIRG